MNKTEKRLYYKNLRRSISAAEVSEKSRIICSNFLSSEFYKAAKTVMLYMPIQNEADTSEILARIFSDNKRAAVPITDGDDIYAAYICKNSRLENGSFDIPEPQNAERAAEQDIDLILVPGIAFDKKGGRIGFGKGYYDRFLPKTNALRVALCYDFQLTDDAMASDFDAPMDYIITEKEVILC